MEALLTIACLFLLLAALAGMSALGHWLLGPIHVRAPNVSLPTRFLLSDFFWLMLQMQVVLAACVAIVGADAREFLAITAVSLVCLVAVWAGAVSWVSRAGVQHPPRRAALMLFLLPATLGLMLAIPLSLAGVLSYLIWVFFSFSQGAWELAAPMAVGSLLGLLALAAGFAACWGVRRTAQWVADGIPKAPISSASNSN